MLNNTLVLTGELEYYLNLPESKTTREEIELI